MRGNPSEDDRECWQWTEGKNNRRGERCLGKAFLIPLSTNRQGHIVPPLHLRPGGWSSAVSLSSLLQSNGAEEALLCVKFSFVDCPSVPSPLSI